MKFIYCILRTYATRENQYSIIEPLTNKVEVLHQRENITNRIAFPSLALYFASTPRVLLRYIYGRSFYFPDYLFTFYLIPIVEDSFTFNNSQKTTRFNQI